MILLHDHRSAATLLGLVATGPSLLAATAKRVIKQTPFLWAIASRTRQLLARLRAPKADAAPANDEPETASE